MHVTNPSKRDIPFGRPSITDQDREAVMRVLSGHILTHGPECKAFEQEFGRFLGEGAHSVTVSSCMAALHLAYLEIGIGSGDEVIVPALTHVATVHAVEWVGARPVFVDADPATGNLTAKAIEAAITPRTKAISMVHFAGIPCAMPEILAVAQRRGLKIVEDCAIAIGARYDGTHVSLFGDIGCFSFYPVKHMTTGEGGMLVSRHPAIAESVARLRAFGVDRSHTERTVPGMYEVPALGLNYRMSEMQAALGRSQLRRLQPSLDRRKENFELLQRELDGVPLTILDSQDPRAAQSHYCLIAVLEGPLGAQRDAVVKKLNDAGIGTSIYYPQPVPRMGYYRKKYGEDLSRFPGAKKISDCSVALPVGPHVSGDDVRYIARTLKEIARQLGL